MLNESFSYPNGIESQQPVLDSKYGLYRGGRPVSPGYLWRLVGGGVCRENLRLQLVYEGLSVVQGGPYWENQW